MTPYHGRRTHAGPKPNPNCEHCAKQYPFACATCELSRVNWVTPSDPQGSGPDRQQASR